MPHNAIEHPFVSRDGLARLDPALARKNERPPSVFIERLRSGDLEFGLLDPVERNESRGARRTDKDDFNVVPDQTIARTPGGTATSATPIASGPDTANTDVSSVERDGDAVKRAPTLRRVTAAGRDDFHGVPDQTNGRADRNAAALATPATSGPERASTNAPSVERTGDAVERIPTGAPSSFVLSLFLPPGSGRSLELHFTALDYDAPEKLRFRYQLEGHDPSPVEVRDRRTAYYTNLKPGQCRFHVAAANNDGVWNDTGAALSFRIAPYFHEPWWFYSMCGAAALALAGTIHHRRLRRAHALHALERQLAVERERTRIARDIHDDLGASVTQLNQLATLAKLDLPPGHPFSAQVEKSEKVLRETVSSMDEIVWAANPQNDNLPSLLVYLRQFAASYLEAAQLETQIDWPDQVPSCAVATEARHHAFLILKEALHNIVDHAAATRVSVQARVETGRLRMVVEDNGCGFDPALARGQGNGLGNMEARTQACDGSLVIESAPGRGTRLVVESNLNSSR